MGFEHNVALMHHHAYVGYHHNTASVKLSSVVALKHSKPKYAHNTHNTTHIELYEGDIFVKKIAISEH